MTQLKRQSLLQIGLIVLITSLASPVAGQLITLPPERDLYDALSESVLPTSKERGGVLLAEVGCEESRTGETHCYYRNVDVQEVSVQAVWSGEGYQHVAIIKGPTHELVLSCNPAGCPDQLLPLLTHCAVAAARAQRTSARFSLELVAPPKVHLKDVPTADATKPLTMMIRSFEQGEGIFVPLDTETITTVRCRLH